MLDQRVISFDIYASSIKYALLKCAPINEHLLASFVYIRRNYIISPQRHADKKNLLF